MSEHHDRGARAPGGAPPHAAAGALESAHPGPRTYVIVAAVLAVITAVEVAVYYVDALRPILAPVLLALSASKFSLVALFYMHLKFDSRLYSLLFVFGLAVAASILVALLALFSYRAIVGA